MEIADIIGVIKDYSKLLLYISVAVYFCSVSFFKGKD